MADFKQAVEWMKEGKKVRRVLWNKYLYYVDKKGVCYPSGESYDYLGHYLNVEATDWEIYEKKESCGDFLKRIGTDGALWAKEFMKLWEDKKDKIDEHLMIGWFCNAIEAGKDSVTQSPLISGGLSFATDESMNVGYERKCEADSLLLLTQPPQSKCKKCGNNWFSGAEIPNCNYIESLSDKLVTPFGFDGDWAKAEDIRISVKKLQKMSIEVGEAYKEPTPENFKKIFTRIDDKIKEIFGDRLTK